MERDFSIEVGVFLLGTRNAKKFMTYEAVQAYAHMDTHTHTHTHVQLKLLDGS